MPQFVLNTPIATATPTIDVDGASPGTHRYQLVVVDEAGNQSAPAEVRVNVLFPPPATFTVATGPQPIALEHDPVVNEVWVVNSGPVEGQRGTVSVVGIAQRAVVGGVVVGVAPAEVALTETGERKLALVTNSGDDSVSAIDLRRRTVLATLKTGPKPLGVDISPDGRWGYVVNSGARPNGDLSIIDLPRLAIAGTVPLGAAPTRVIFSPSGKEAFVNNTGDGTVSIIDVASQRVSAVVNVGPGAASSPLQAAVSARDYPVWTVNQGTKSLSRIAADRSVRDFEAGIAGEGIAILSSGARAFATGPADAALSMVDSSGTHRVPIRGPGGSVASLAMNPSGHMLVLAQPVADALSFYDAQSLTLLAAAPVPKTPVRVIVTADGKLACATCQNAGLVVFADLSGLPS